MRKPSRIILVIVLIIIVVFLIVNRILDLKSILKSSHDILWSDKSNKYLVWEYSIKDLDIHDSCNKLSFVTTEGKEYKRLECIFKIGGNDHFIIAQTNQNTNIKYWIINKDKDNSKLMPAQIVEGPLDSIQFIIRKREFNINEIDFQIEFK